MKGQTVEPERKSKVTLEKGRKVIQVEDDSQRTNVIITTGASRWYWEKKERVQRKELSRKAKVYWRPWEITD